MTAMAGFIGTIAAGFFSVFLLGWHGYNGASTDWIYGFLAVFWSLLMMLRLMTLTTPFDAVEAPSNLAQKLVQNVRERQEEARQNILANSFGGSFALFLCAVFIFAAWQVYCAAFPAQSLTIDTLQNLIAAFSSGASLHYGRMFDWGQVFMLLLSFSMMGFVLRSHAAQKGATRATLIILCGYAVAGLLTFAGLEPAGHSAVFAPADVVGNGSGAAAYLLGGLREGQALSLFDILLLESGIAGLGILTFMLFVPLGYLSLAAQNRHADRLVTGCGLIVGTVMILSVFLTFTPLIGGFMAMCWMGLFLSWGASENTVAAFSLTKEQK